jgi:hypothetical protein
MCCAECCTVGEGGEGDTLSRKLQCPRRISATHGTCEGTMVVLSGSHACRGSAT